MLSKIKNIIIIVVIVVGLILAYVFIFKKAPEQASLVSSTGNPALPTSNEEDNSLIGKDFISLLLNVKNIKLDDSIFTEPAWLFLRDNVIDLSIESSLIPSDVGRYNPYAPIGSDISAAPINAFNQAPAPAPLPTTEFTEEPSNY